MILNKAKSNESEGSKFIIQLQLMHNFKRMKFYITLIFIFSIIIQADAQDSAVHLSPKMMDKNQVIELYGLDGWQFHEGHNPAWASPDMNTTGWRKLKPANVSKQLADKNGKIEGWFRLKIWLDSSFGNMPLNLSVFNRGAADTYVDGKLFEAYGNTGVNGKAYNAPYRTSNLQIQPIILVRGKEHLIAIHFVNYVPPFPLNLITLDNSVSLFLILGGPALEPATNAFFKKLAIYQTVTITVCAVLSLLFWLLAFQNPLEKNLRLIALSPTFFGLSGLLEYFLDQSKLSLAGFSTINALQFLFTDLMLLLTPLILAKIFFNYVSRKLLVFLGILFIIFYYTRLVIALIPLLIVVIIIMAISAYFVIASWKTIKGAKWAIAAGVLITLFWVLIYVIIKLIELTPLSNGELMVVTLLYVSIPLSLLVYVSLRFREIISEVRETAAKVLQVTEEKRQQALNQQKLLEQEVKRQTADLTEALQNLKATQSQLIQSEKMASLGELTAGIAHEIQNPLNFVNNFSEVNKEMIDELQTELEAGNTEEAIAISNDIKDNEEKINHHGKRADAIVKGMLQHSRQTKGVKELTDINALCDEYLRLSYHGLRAKDKSFNAEFKTDFDKSIEKINVVPQDIGRVLLNLCNNAFYAVSEKKKTGDENYQPAVLVQTKKENNNVRVTVSDNGNGVPQNIIDKIFQPFFTTKPTGEGTGLGLSLSYDIIKVHGGNIHVETKEGEKSEFVISLPVT